MGVGATIRDTAETGRTGFPSQYFMVSSLCVDEQWQCEKVLFVNVFLLFVFMAGSKITKFQPAFLKHFSSPISLK